MVQNAQEQSPLNPFWDRNIETKRILQELLVWFLVEVSKKGLTNVSINDVAERHLGDPNKSKNFHKYFRRKEDAPLNTVALMFLLYRYYWMPLNQQLQAFVAHTKPYMDAEIREREIVSRIVRLLVTSSLDDPETPIDEGLLFRVLCREALNRDIYRLMTSNDNAPYHQFMTVLCEALRDGSGEDGPFKIRLEPQRLAPMLIYRLWSLLSMSHVGILEKEEFPEALSQELRFLLNCDFDGDLLVNTMA